MVQEMSARLHGWSETVARGQLGAPCGLGDGERKGEVLRPDGSANTDESGDASLFRAASERRFGRDAQHPLSSAGLGALLASQRVDDLALGVVGPRPDSREQPLLHGRQLCGELRVPLSHVLENQIVGRR